MASRWVSIGEGDSAVTLTAESVGCDPPEGEDCVAIPTGADVQVEFGQVDADVWGVYSVAINPRDEFLFLTVLEQSQPAMEATPFEEGSTCDDYEAPAK